MKIYLLVFVCFCITFYSCKKDKDASSETVFARKDFPATAGSYWTYAYTSRFQQQAEYKATLTHRIERVESLSGDTQVIYYAMYNAQKFVDSAKGILCNTGFTYLGTLQSGYSTMGDFHLEFPLYPDKSWQSTEPVDTLKVLYQAGSYTLPIGSFKYVFYLYNKYQRGAMDISENEILLSKNVGVVMRNLNRQGKDWEGREGFTKLTLMDYHIQ